MTGIGVSISPGATVDDLVRLTRDHAAPCEKRLAAGAQLARVGDPRPGALTLEPAWCVVAAGAFVVGSGSGDGQASSDERPQHVLRLPEFRISRYPVTNAQWLRFVGAGPYHERRWWSEEGWRAVQAARWSAPRFWRAGQWPDQANRPAVGVSWHEANAYCRWLSEQLAYDVRLCTEAEWEKAARGTDGRLYPSGDALDPDAVHAAQSLRVPGPAPVGCYPRGASPWGVEDMVGNTYAWTSSRWGRAEGAPDFWHPYDDQDGREDPAGDDYRVVRGGAYGFPLRNVRCAYRGKDRPRDAFDNLGVRLVSRA